MTVLAEVVDPQGQRVELTVERWQHIIRADGHPELAGFQAEVLCAVEAPDRRHPGRRRNEQWFLLERTGLSQWLHVVVAYEGERGWIVTAFPRRSLPADL